MSKIYIEARFKMPVLDTDEFGYDKEEVEKVDWEQFAKDDFWNSCEDMGELEDKYDITFHKVQPKLRIPKKIAEQADKTDFDELFQRGQEEFYQWFDHEHDEYKEVIYAYLAGKALGVELVEVEG